MYKFFQYFLIILTLFLFSGCAWENLPDGDAPVQKIVMVRLTCGGDLNPNYFYYIVFNFSGDQTKRPQSIFSGPDRGKYWQIYYMWGTPPLETTGLYRGLGGITKAGANLVDRFPQKTDFLTELLPGTIVEGNSMILRIDLTGIPKSVRYLNMNMIVCNQAIDAKSKLEYEFEPYIFDSFYQGGITIDLEGTADFYNEAFNPQEHIKNENEDIAPPSANIVDWIFRRIV